MSALDLYDIFDLLGLRKLGAYEKKIHFNKMQNVIMEEFYFNVISSIKDKELLLNLDQMVKQKETPSKIIEFLSSSIPNFAEELIGFIRSRKKEYIKNYYKNIVEDLDRRLTIAQNNRSKIYVKKQLKYYLSAQKLANKEEWGNLSVLTVRSNLSVT